jgi:hypothetical protein
MARSGNTPPILGEIRPHILAAIVLSNPFLYAALERERRRRRLVESLVAAGAGL